MAFGKKLSAGAVIAPLLHLGFIGISLAAVFIAALKYELKIVGSPGFAVIRQVGLAAGLQSGARHTFQRSLSDHPVRQFGKQVIYKYSWTKAPAS